MTKQEQLNKEWEPHPILLEEIQKTQHAERPNMLSKILTAIGIRRPKNPPPITAEEQEVFERAREMINNADPDELSYRTSFTLDVKGKTFYFECLNNYEGKHTWPTNLLYMDYKRPELGGALYELVRQRVEKRRSEYREAKRAEFLGRENSGGNSVPKPKPQAPPNEFRPI
jgi:hypothetical protein